MIPFPGDTLSINDDETAGHIGTLSLTLYTLYLFLALSRLSGSFFCPNLSFLSTTLSLSQSVSGLTLAALGNGAADLFSTAAAFQRHSDGLALGELIGSSLFTATFLSGLIAFWYPFDIPQRPYIRDLIVFTLCLITTALFVALHRIRFWQSLGMMLFYTAFVYCVSRGIGMGSSHPLCVVEDGTAEWESTEVEPLLPESAEETIIFPEDEIGALESALLGIIPDLNKQYEGYARPWPRMDSQIDLVDGTVDLSANAVSDLNSNPPIIDEHDYADITAEAIVVVDDEEPAIDSTLQSTIPSIVESPSSPAPLDQYSSWTAYLRRILYLVVLLDVIKPERWRAASLLKRVKLLVNAPILLVGKYSIPIARTSLSPFRKVQFCIQCMLCPWIVWLIMHASASTDATPGLSSVSGTWGFPETWYYIISSVLAGITSIFAMGVFHPLPRWFPLYMGVLGFMSSMLWIYLAASELAIIFTAVSKLTQLSGVAIGLSFFAIGNCVGDIMTNIHIAKSGLPLLAFGACIGSSLLNIILGIGISSFSLTLQNRLDDVELVIRSPGVLIFACCSLCVALWAGCVTVMVNGWRVDWRFSMVMISLYIFILLSIFLIN